MRNTVSSATAPQHLSDNAVWRELRCDCMKLFSNSIPPCTREKGVTGVVHRSIAEHTVRRSHLSNLAQVRLETCVLIYQLSKEIINLTMLSI